MFSPSLWCSLFTYTKFVVESNLRSSNSIDLLLALRYEWATASYPGCCRNLTARPPTQLISWWVSWQSVVGGQIGGGVLEIAAAARLLFLGLNVFMNLERGLIGMLDGAMLQVPGGQSSCGTVNTKKTHGFIYFFKQAWLQNKWF